MASVDVITENQRIDDVLEAERIKLDNVGGEDDITETTALTEEHEADKGTNGLKEDVRNGDAKILNVKVGDGDNESTSTIEEENMFKTKELKEEAGIVLKSVIVTAYGVIQVVVGAVYMDDCPVEPLIPVYLIVAGAIFIVFGNFSCHCVVYRGLTIQILCGLIGAVLTIVWGVCGNIWVHAHLMNATGPVKDPFLVYSHNSTSNNTLDGNATSYINITDSVHHSLLNHMENTTKFGNVTIFDVYSFDEIYLPPNSSATDNMTIPIGCSLPVMNMTSFLSKFNLLVALVWAIHEIHKLCRSNSDDDDGNESKV